MKGYPTGDGYMGFVDGRYMLFADEADYYEYVRGGGRSGEGEKKMDGRPMPSVTERYRRL